MEQEETCHELELLLRAARESLESLPKAYFSMSIPLFYLPTRLADFKLGQSFPAGSSGIQNKTSRNLEHIGSE